MEFNHEEKILRHLPNGVTMFYCPGCKCCHGVNIKDPSKSPYWNFNGNEEKPTFSPSVRSRGISFCHCYVEEGRIRFLKDSNHQLSGKTVDMELF